MAITKIVPTKIGNFNEPTTTPTTILVGVDGAEILFNGKDDRILISVDTADVTIKAGNGIQGIVDLTVSSGKSVCLTSGSYKNVSGDHKGSVFVTGATAKVSAIELP